MPNNHFYDLGFGELRNYILKHKPRRVLIQLPDGLKFLAQGIIGFIRATARWTEVYLSSSPSYGACDIAYDEAEALGADAIIHFGHNKYPYQAYSRDMDVIYIPVYYTGPLTSKTVGSVVEYLRSRGFGEVAIVASLQYVKLASKLMEKLREEGFKAYIPEQVAPHMLNGQVLGCEYRLLWNIRADTVLVVSSGLFHGLGVCLYKPYISVAVVDPVREETIDLAPECKRVLAKRLYLVSQLINSNPRKAVIIAGTAPGQYRQWLVNSLSLRLSRTGIDVFLVSSRYLDRERLIAIDQAFKPDFYVVTSCPRLPIDDLGDFYKPVLTPGEAFMFLDKTLSYRYPW